ncbi:acyl-CoA dehydrogenase family protein [Microbacterium sp. KSW4-11]|uniref:Dibenzothiophene monooxygenase n=1 Tax=Microbacterium gawkjiense TaxID=3067309 RepID=A0ABU3GA16_9MICO|nr:acyl-CoA dehydrogenase family protein [Microbacterium sp. KSW4-11]MDT3316370.1 acyl-CoA dehydrogenase family protein [Microbacterium sp. KSW4-11]
MSRVRDAVHRFTAVFDDVGRDAVTRERDRRLPHAEVAALREAGFTRVTLPEEFGGGGEAPSVLFELLAELARRDPNLAQLFRSHFSFVDRTVLAPPSSQRTRRLELISSGAIVGNASHERSTAKVGTLATTLADSPDGLVLDGTKYYSTGTLFADLVSVAAQDEGGALVSALVPTNASGVEVIDDWTGFGQRMTGSGTTVFRAVTVTEDAVSRRLTGGPSHGGAFVQLVLLATVAGIGRAIVDDAVQFVQTRTRTFSHGSAAMAREDPIVQETVGRLSALAFAADSALASAAAGLDESTTAQQSGASGEELRAIIEPVEASTTRAQLVILPSVLDAATLLFEVGGASAVDTGLALDRHWRNARTIASHNPTPFKARALGDLLLNGIPVPGWWSTGEA